ncbi:uncharacterized protein EDB91DRAFT_887330 [Suillus paluster]|uniref:uncharacterized protein n=1 Tax=Suillus paluster TaxID=48578 RepID=UPI001B86AA4A|nr:uncharacterized protein EDB91DRAFT_887330 [Suillus paluster]KAG1727786.1 hypothetical protein EDB91DRAFT_887330 [Suillus paluster]
MFAVQCFYAERVWIITGKNRLITGIICVLATTSFVCGMILSGLIFHTRSAEVLFSTQLSPASTSASAICDVFITGSIWLFIRPARTDNIRVKSKSHVNRMMWIFIHMGLFSCIVATTTAVLYQFQDSVIGQFYAAAPGAVIGKSYTNSMMAVLNARKSIREQERLACNTSDMISFIYGLFNPRPEYGSMPSILRLSF